MPPRLYNEIMKTDIDSHLTEALPETADALAEAAAAWFVRLRAEHVSAAEQAHFEAWLKASASHARAYEEISAFWNDPGFIRVLAEPPASLGAVKRRPARAKRRHFGRLGLAVAACLALLAVILRPVSLDCLQADYCTAVGEVKVVDLDDGSRVMLNTDSALKVDMTNGLRHVGLMRGEAFFDVRRDANRPFVVDGQHSHTRVKGTQFLVRDGKSADTVTVISGLVEVSLNGQDSSLLRENDQISVEDGKLGEVHQATGSVAPWMKGKLLFDNTPLAEVVAEIARYRRGLLMVKTDGLKMLRVSGRFDVADTDKALESLAQTLPIRIYRITPWLLVIV